MAAVEISKTYSPKEVESKLLKYWDENKFYSPDVKSSKPKYSIVIPPPNVTGNLTVGHILNNTIQDIYARWKRMSGYNVLWLPGTDHAGIATQTVVERQLKQQKLSRYDLGREKFVQKVWEWKDVYHKNIKLQLERMGASVDWSRERFTMDEGLSYAVRKVFVDLYNKGLIYKGKRIVNWDPVAQTAISDEEVVYKEKKDKLYYIKYPLLNGENKFITIATTRPETMLGDTAVAVNPDDKRYANLIGKRVRLPIAEREIPIIADRYVDMEFGTGALKITPAHDPNDFEIGQKYNLESLQVIDHEAKMNENAGKYSGLDRFEARKHIVARLEELGLIEKVENYVHNIGYSERGGALVEPYLSDQWFVSMKPLAEPALNAVLSGAIRFYPERWLKVYEYWMKNIRDWCISRQLWWGHRIPVWYHKGTGEKYCGMEPPKDLNSWEQDPDVLDTWFSSWLWPFTTMGWPKETQDLKTFFPTDMLSTAPEIIFFWVARMIMASLEFTGKIPFTVVYFHSIIRDDKGRKMSKSLGNSPNVFDIMDKYGTDALRFSLVYLAPQGIDVFFSEQKCELGRNFANKLWNAARFLMTKNRDLQVSSVVRKQANSLKTDLFDKWIQSRLNSTIKNYINSLEEYKINEASRVLHEFVWGDFCDWYIEVLKIKLNESPEIINDAFEIFEKILKMLHPVMPFITEELWQTIINPPDLSARPSGGRTLSNQSRKLENKSVMSISISDFPVADESLISGETERQTRIVQDIITAIRNLRAEMNISPAVKCNVAITCKDAFSKALVAGLSKYIIPLARLEKMEIGLGKEIPLGKKVVASVVDDYHIYLRIEGLIDIEKEKERLSKEIVRMEDFLQAIEKKLNNHNFVNKASSEVVENEKKKSEDTRSKLERLKMYYNSL